MAAGLQQVVEAEDVGLDIHVRVVDAPAHPRLGGEVHHHVKAVFFKKLLQQGPVPEGAAHEHMAGPRTLRGLLDLPKAILLEAHLIIVVHIVEGHDGAALQLPQQAEHEIGPDKAGRACDQDVFSVEINGDFHILPSFVLWIVLRSQNTPSA